MKKWEYETHTSFSINLKKDLSRFGNEGWELVNIYRRSGDMQVFLTFKRPLDKK